VLTWETLSTPAADYSVFIHVRDLEATIGKDVADLAPGHALGVAALVERRLLEAQRIEQRTLQHAGLHGGVVRVVGEAVPRGERELIESTKLGTIQMSMVSGAMAGFYKPAMVLDIPYLFPSAAVAWNVLDGEYGRDLANDILKNLGTRVLAYGETGFRNFTNSKHTIKSPADMKGLKLRVMETPLYMTLVKSLGANPTPIAWPETYSALQQKVVDGQENPVATILQAKFSEVQKYLTLDGHTYGADFIIVNEKFYQGLPKEQQNLLKRAAIVAGTCGRGIQQLNSAVGISELKKLGMEIYAPTASERKAFMQATQGPVIDWMKTQVDPNAIKKVQAAVAKEEAALNK